LSDPNKSKSTINMDIRLLMVQADLSGGQGGMNMDDIFSQFGDIFGSTFGGGGSWWRRRRSTLEGSNLHIKVKLTLEK
jgi:molecular chaperone DnaJ